MNYPFEKYLHFWKEMLAIIWEHFLNLPGTIANFGLTILLDPEDYGIKNLSFYLPLNYTCDFKNKIVKIC